MHIIVDLISAVCGFLWGDLITLPLPGGGSVGLSLLVLLLIPTGIYFTFRTRFLPLRLFPEMLRVTAENSSCRRFSSATCASMRLFCWSMRLSRGESSS